MTTFTVQVDEKTLRRFVAAMGKLASREAMGAAGEDLAIYLWGLIPPYPPSPPNSSYRRTHKMGQHFVAGSNVSEDGFEVYIGNRMEYAPWVVSSKTVVNRHGKPVGPQAWMHVGRWWTLQDVIQKNAQNIADRAKAIFRSIIG